MHGLNDEKYVCHQDIWLIGRVYSRMNGGICVRTERPCGIDDVGGRGGGVEVRVGVRVMRNPCRWLLVVPLR